MSNPVLQSESFERAAYSLGRELGDFPGVNFAGSISEFQRAVDKFGRLLAMQAENDRQKYDGIPYGEHDFLNA